MDRDKTQTATQTHYSEVVEALFTEYLNADHSGNAIDGKVQALSSEIDRQIEAGAVDVDTIGEYEYTATRAGFYAGYKAGFFAVLSAIR